MKSFWYTIGQYGLLVLILVNIVVGWYWGFLMAVVFGAGSILGSVVTAGKSIKVLEDTLCDLTKALDRVPTSIRPK